MSQPVPAPRFRRADKSIGDLGIATTSHIITAATDVALVLDTEGVIRDLAVGDVGAPRATYDVWLDRPWVDTVTVESRSKVEQLLADARAQEVGRPREINQRADGAPDLPVRFAAVRLGDDGRVLALGRDLRAVAQLQQQLISAQQAMEREYARLRQAETRYRLLFQVSSEGVLIVDAQTSKVVEANPAASAQLELAPQRLTGTSLAALFDAESWPRVEAMLASLRTVGRSGELPARLASSGRAVGVSASLFRQASTAYVLLRLTSPTATEAAPRTSRALEIITRLPEGFVVVDAERRVLLANPSFLEMTQLATEEQARGQPIDKWLGRPGVDVGLLVATLREHGAVRNFGTIVRGEYGGTEEVELSGVTAGDGDELVMGFVLRSMRARALRPNVEGQALPRSVEQLTGLVGRVSLKEIVRETTDLIEKLCIEAALEVSKDNRASAAQMLGLSRQSLYSKMRRHGLGDLDPEPEGET
jgi:transcriptional regulator PpsR